jgi:hypothetical protein
MAYQGLNEHDLVEIRQALEQPTLAEAISAMEQVLASLGYVRLARMPREERALSGDNKDGTKNKGFRVL